MKKHLFILIAFMAISSFALAQKFESGGIYYSVTSASEPRTVAVTCKYEATPYNDTNTHVGNVIIPETVTYEGNTYTVTTIGENAFQNCRELTGVTMPNSVTMIGRIAFANCANLESVTLGNAVTMIDEGAFEFCTSLASITLGDSVTSIGYTAFYGCTSLASIALPNSLKSIKQSTFERCTSLASVTLGDSVTSIGYYAFQGCESLAGITLPNSLKSISPYAFRNCTSLASITLGNLVATIGNNAFYNCTSLTSVTLGNSVTSIDYTAFYGCTSLAQFTIKAVAPPTLSSNVFGNTSSALSIYVPCQSVAAYQAATNWSGYSSRIVGSVATSLSFAVNNPAMGSAKATESNCAANTAVIQAYPTVGHHFVQWQDGNTSNPRTVTVTGDTTYTATFEVNAAPVYITLTVQANNAAMGTVTGGGSFEQYSVQEISATAATGHKFVKWNDGITTATRSITVSQDTTFTAEFEVLYYTLTGNTNNATYGTVSGGGSYAYNSSATLTATPLANRRFVKWNDDNTENPRTVTITAAITYTATFEIIYHTITVKSNDDNMGTVSGGGSIEQGKTATLSATPKSNHYFVQWNDGNTVNPRTVTVTEATTYTAQFASNATPNVSVTVLSNDNVMGSVIGSGSYLKGTTVSLGAFANTGHQFVKWHDDVTANPRQITANSDTTFTAIFEALNYTITATSNNTAMGSVTGGGSYAYNTTATMTATPTANHRFVKWNDDNTDNPRTITVTGAASYAATFESINHTITVLTNNDTMGSVSGGGTYLQGTPVVLSATANADHRFVQWQDGNTDNPRAIVVTEDATYTAEFVSTVGIAHHTQSNINIYPNPTTGEVRFENGEVRIASVEVFDITGRKQHAEIRESDGGVLLNIAHLPSGVYLVKAAGRVWKVVKR